MSTGLWATLGGIVALALALLKVFTTKKDVRDEKRRDLAQVEADETDVALAAVDRELDGMQSPPSDQRVLLSPDDHL